MARQPADQFGHLYQGRDGDFGYELFDRRGPNPSDPRFEGSYHRREAWGPETRDNGYQLLHDEWPARSGPKGFVQRRE